MITKIAVKKNSNSGGKLGILYWWDQGSSRVLGCFTISTDFLF